MTRPPVRHRIGLVLALVVVTVSFTFTAIPSFGVEGVTIQYWHINSPSFGGPAVRELVRRFEARHPGITVHEKFQPGVYTGLVQQLQAALAAKQPPDVAQIGYNLLAYVAETFPHTPVQTFRSADQAFFAGFRPTILALGQYKGIQHGMPYGLSVPVMYYNADLLEQAGANPTMPPATWGDVLRVGRTVKEKTGKWGIYLQEPNDDWMFQYLVYANGGELLAPDGKHVAFASREAAQALQLWADLVNKEHITPNVAWDEGENSFLAGNIAMYITTIGKRGNLQAHASFDLRTAPVPTVGTKPRRVAAGGNALFLFSTDPLRQRAAWEFIKYLLSPEGETLWTEATGYLPPRLTVAQDPAYLKPFFRKNTLMKAALDTFPAIAVWQSFPGPHGLEVTKIIIDATQEILSGQRPAEVILRDAAARADQLLSTP
jgi:multiple sugar transport system substrate-binding protein